MSYSLQLPAWRKRLEGEKAAQRYAAEAATRPPRVAAPGVLPPVGQTASFIRRFYDALPNPFAWLLDSYDDYPPRRGARMPPPISGEQTVPTTLAHPPGTAGATSTYLALRRRRH